jgi:hypothetical protein
MVSVSAKEVKKISSLCTFKETLLPVHVDNGGCDGDAHTQGSRQQAAHTAQLNLRRRKKSDVYFKITDSGMPRKLDIHVQNTVKKSIVFPFPRRDVSNQTLPGRELGTSWLGREKR